MPYYYYEEIKTPLKLIGIRIMRDDKGGLWFKIGKQSRRRLTKGTSLVSDNDSQREKHD
jgi:hypothetical protein